MKFSEHWLREWVDPSISAAQLADQLTMAGLEVAALTTVVPGFRGVVVGEVLSCEKHPEADRLKYCQVNVGAAAPIAIVCGASNVRAGLRVPVALVGAQLPNNIKIKQSKIRNLLSQGMICSAKELGIAQEGQEHGILELEDTAPIGMDIGEYLSLHDTIMDVELTPNRADCLSIRGIAREVGVINRLPLAQSEQDSVKPALQENLPIQIKAKDACPHYAGRIIQNIHYKMTPRWMMQRLQASGLRCVHPVVDICNYVMLELGQPLHAFDLQHLQGDIEVRYGKVGESITVLDGTEIALTTQTLVIADREKPQAIAGVMGGLSSAVSVKTTAIFLESAYFNPLAVRRNIKAHNLRTDASYRFERGVDFALQREALERAADLIQNILGGAAGGVSEICISENLPKRLPILLRRQRVSRLLGVTIDDAEVTRILSALGMTLTVDAAGWLVSIPSYRFDVESEVDLIEELARIHGYESIPLLNLQASLKMQPVKETTVDLAVISKTLVDRNYFEAITYSFVNKELQQYFSVPAQQIEISNPISVDMAVMRTSLWPGLITALQYNMNRQVDTVRLFESGLCFIQNDGDWQQQQKIGLIAYGRASAKQWGLANREVDFYDVKADIEVLLALTGQENLFAWEPTSHKALHPGQSAILKFKGLPVGILGALHPELANQLDIPGNCYLFEADLCALSAARLPQYKIVSKFPAICRDLAIIIDNDILVADVLNKMRSTGGHLLNNLQLFDVYTGKGIASGKKSIALGLTFQDPSRTLVDTEINDLMQDIIAILEKEFKATLRS